MVAEVINHRRIPLPRLKNQPIRNITLCMRRNHKHSSLFTICYTGALMYTHKQLVRKVAIDLLLHPLDTTYQKIKGLSCKSTTNDLLYEQVTLVTQVA